MNEWVIEWMKEWMNEWTNERTNEWVQEMFSFFIKRYYLYICLRLMLNTWHSLAFDTRYWSLLQECYAHDANGQTCTLPG